MKAYLFLAIGVLWIATAVILQRTGFSVFWPNGALNPDRVDMVFRLVLPLIFFGWVVPIMLGLWLMWAKKQ